MGVEHGTPSLVRGSKSSTDLPDEEIDILNAWMADLAKYEREQLGDFPQGMLDDACLPRPFEELEEDEQDAGKYLKLQCEAWRNIKQTTEGAYYTPLDLEDGLYRATAYTETRGKNIPPPQSGDRWTERLSDRAKKKIEDAALYMHKTGRGFRTFLTLTFSPEFRALIEKWDQQGRNEEGRRTIGQLVTEFLNVLQQRHRNGLVFEGHFRRAGKQQRGGSYKAKSKYFRGTVEAWGKSSRWTPIKWRDGFKIPAQNRPFQNIWVIENPVNGKGEANPHVHILMNWHVSLDQFHAWSMWIEKTWGKGFAKLERIKKPRAAASYMAKAANYISKGSEGEQGDVRGNRYNISAVARAPNTKAIGVFSASWIRDAMQALLEAGRQNLPKGLWVHAHGFGANSKSAWKLMWAALKKVGFQLKPAPVSLALARFRNVRARYLQRRYDYFTQANEALFRQFSEQGRNVPELSLNEFEERHQWF